MNIESKLNEKNILLIKKEKNGLQSQNSKSTKTNK